MEKMPVSIKRMICLCLCIGLISSSRRTEEILFRKVKTRLEWIEGSVAVWSGVAWSRGHCSSLCAREPKCVSLAYVNKDKFCKLLSILYKLDENAEEGETEYYMIDRANNRRLPESCADLANCSGTSTDGEYWLYPQVMSGQRVKVYCHNMETNPKEYITLKYTNTFVEHDASNWIIQWQQCRNDYKPPLKLANFSRVSINIQKMTINGADYTFAVRTGKFKLEFGQAMDCNGASSFSSCPHFGDAMINTLGTGIILDGSTAWGLIAANKAVMKNFRRSEDGAKISFTCGGWCGVCGPLSLPLRFILSSEFGNLSFLLNDFQLFEPLALVFRLYKYLYVMYERDDFNNCFSLLQEFRRWKTINQITNLPIKFMFYGQIHSVISKEVKMTFEEEVPDEEARAEVCTM